MAPRRFAGRQTCAEPKPHALAHGCLFLQRAMTRARRNCSRASRCEAFGPAARSIRSISASALCRVHAAKIGRGGNSFRHEYRRISLGVSVETRIGSVFRLDNYGIDITANVIDTGGRHRFPRGQEQCSDTGRRTFFNFLQGFTRKTTITQGGGSRPIACGGPGQNLSDRTSPP
jgi:hypothetical protein